MNIELICLFEGFEGIWGVWKKSDFVGREYKMGMLARTVYVVDLEKKKEIEKIVRYISHVVPIANNLTGSISVSSGSVNSLHA